MLWMNCRDVDWCSGMSRRSRKAGSATLNQPDLFSFAKETAARSAPLSIVQTPKANVAELARQARSTTAAVLDRPSGPGPAQRHDARDLSRPAVAARQPQPANAQQRHPEQSARMLTVEDMPSYPPDLVAAAKRSIEEAATERVLLTYKEIDAFFGISRATVARRLKDGLVPGIRIWHGRVLEDGPVRRLDQTQVLYLLLAVRARRP